MMKIIFKNIWWIYDKCKLLFLWIFFIVLIGFMFFIINVIRFLVFKLLIDVVI